MIIQYDKRAKKFIESQDRPTKQRIKKAIEGLTEQPPKGDPESAKLKVLQTQKYSYFTLIS